MDRIHRYSLLTLFILCIVVNSAWLNRVPGLLGDEGDEGQRVFEVLHDHPFTVVGERSYIGPLTTYVRIPFILIFGYQVLSLRILMFLITGISFWLAADVFQRLFDKKTSLFMLAFVFFSPIYLLYQRLGWAITLLPFFILLLLWLSVRKQTKYTYLLIGIVAGIGLSTHILFLPSLIALLLIGLFQLPRNWSAFSPWIMAVVGFWGAFAMQFTVLMLQHEDQGDPIKVVTAANDRISHLPSALFYILSGSAHIAKYIGHGLPMVYTSIIFASIAIFVFIALFFYERPKVSLAWFITLAIHLCILLLIIDRYTLRYFTVFSIGIWGLAGVGMAIISKRLFSRWPTISTFLPIGVALILSGFIFSQAWLPFLATGGSVNKLTLLPNTDDSASLMVDTRQLIMCIRGLGPVFSKNQHILDRLVYESHRYSDIVIANDSHKAQYIIVYRSENQTAPHEACPDLAHFRVIPH